MNRIIPRLILASLAVGFAHGAGTDEGAAFFEAKVLPLLQRRCYECHSHEKKIKGGLALDLRKGWETGGDNGPAIVPGQPDRSLLVKAVRYTDADIEMPPKEKLDAAEIGLLEKWVAMGAPDSRVVAAVPASKKREIDIEQGRRFWAFQPVVDSKVPEVRDEKWPLDSVDRFILAKRITEGSPDRDARLDALWLRVLNRPIAAAEREDAAKFFDAIRIAATQDSDLAPWIELGHALLSSNEFLLRM